MVAVQFTITGRVQGVYYRANAKRKAEELGITGWVANNADGSVTLHAEGNESQLQDLEAWCWMGPTGAQVISVTAKAAPEEKAEAFEIVY